MKDFIGGILFLILACGPVVCGALAVSTDMAFIIPGAAMMAVWMFAVSHYRYKADFYKTAYEDQCAAWLAAENDIGNMTKRVYSDHIRNQLTPSRN